MNRGVSLSAPLINDDSTHAGGERMKRSLAAQAAFFARQPSPLILSALLFSAAGARAVLGPAGWEDLVVVAAVFAYWPFQEWFLHRYLLHMKPRTILGVRFDPHFARAHRAHHRQPWIVELTFLPTKVVLALVPISILSWVAIAPTVPLAATGIAGSAAAAVLYEWTHYLTHSAYVPRTDHARRIFRNHRMHHFKNEKHWFAFTIPAIETVLRTDPDPHAVEKSETVRTLGIED